MKWLLMNVPFYEVAHIIHDVITKTTCSLYRKYVYSFAVYQKYLTSLGELIIFEPWRENYHFSQPS